MNYLEKARKSAGMSQEAAAAIIGISKQTYRARETNPDSMSIREYKMLRAEFDEFDREILDKCLV